MKSYRAVVRVPGSCGEMVQGMIDGVFFHVTCPIDMFSTVEVRLSPDVDGVEHPPQRVKAAQAVSKTLAFLRQTELGARLSISSPLPQGKGMASSTADVAGAIAATAMALGERLDPKDIARIALDIEPTDGTFCPGIVAFDHREGKLCHYLGEPPPLEIVVLDFGGEVDTVKFNQVDRRLTLHALEPEVRQAFQLVKEGINSGDPALLARGTTLSALANQRLLFKPELEKVMSLSKEAGALGVNTAHSGTVSGVLLDSRQHQAKAIHDFLVAHLPGLRKAFVCSLVSGGIQEDSYPI